jgi:protease-4
VEYAKQLGKKVITFIVMWNVVLVCISVSFILPLVFLAMIGSQAQATTPYTYYEPVYGSGTNQLLSINVNGLITGTDTGADSIFSSLDSQTAGYTVKDKLYAAADDPLIKGVILEIDSPGGTIYGANAIADGVKYYRDTTKQPVYAHISGLGASGAYWGAASADKVYADKGSEVGSIGVIMGPFTYFDKPLAFDNGILGGGIVTQNGIETVTITSGKSKDVGNPFRRMTGAEVAELQRQINNEYDGFVKYVSERRGIPDPTIRTQIGAMIYDTKTAAELKLTDGTLNRHETYEKLAEAAKVQHDYSVVQETPNLGFVGSLLSAIGQRPKPEAAKKIDLCTLTHVSLAYHGDVSGWCK